jgi:two-component sensor histidine kinase
MLVRLAGRFPPMIGYPVAIAAVILALIVRTTALAMLPGYAFITFFPVIVVVAALCGLGPGLLATALSAFAALYFLMEPAGTFDFANGWEVVALATCVGIALLVCFLMHALGRTVRLLLAERHALELARDHAATLYRELDHRVRNSLQLAGSMLAVQASGNHEEPKVSAALDDATARVRAIGLVHESLAISSGLGDVELDRYMTKFCQELTRHTTLDCRVDVEPIKMATRRASILAMIAHELTTNVAKYAYPGVAGGPIRISCRREPSGMIRLTVADAGVGLPPSVQPGEGGGLGMRIIRALVAQLDGRLEIARQGGTQTSVIVPGS